MIGFRGRQYVKIEADMIQTYKEKKYECPNKEGLENDIDRSNER